MSCRWLLLAASFAALGCDADDGASADAAAAESSVASGGNGGGSVGGSGGGGVMCPPAEECPALGSLLFGACVASDEPNAFDGGVSDSKDIGASLDESSEVQLTGSVERIDEAPVDCGAVGFGTSGTGTRTFVVSDGDASLNVVVKLPGELPLLEVGDHVRVDYQRDATGAFSEGPPSKGHLELRDAAGQLLLWIGRSPRRVEHLPTPSEVSVENGAMRCAPADRYLCPELRSVKVTIDGQAVDVPYRETRNLGDYAVMHGENIESANSGGHPMLVGVVRGAL